MARDNRDPIERALDALTELKRIVGPEYVELVPCENEREKPRRPRKSRKADD